jgi:hypothetical protein
MADWFTDGLISRGIPPHIATAFAMNAMDESGMNPGINEIEPIVPGSRGGYGLMQWTGPRRRALEAFAAEKGMDVSNPDLQLDFLVSELHGPEAGAWGKISAAGDTGSAAAAIVNDFLRPAESNRSKREAEYLGGKAYAGAPNIQTAPQGQPTQPSQEPPAPSPDNALRAPQLAMMDPSQFMNMQPNALAIQPISGQRTNYLSGRG